MARPASVYICQACGATAAKWSGKCDNCGEWNTLTQEALPAPVSGARGSSLPAGRATALTGLKGDEPEPQRIETGIAELDRVAGGGFVPGSGVLIGGDPGIGKSTLLLQAMARLAQKGHRVIYVSGEEAIAQIRLRASRLGVSDQPVLLASETNVSDILATLAEGGAPAVTVIDSVQTLWSPVVEAAPGTVSQLRAGAEALVRFAKQRGSTVLLVGHVTKDGQIAGPKVVEHMVDTVLYFEGDRGHQFRILRAVKNRFGPTDEIGVFEMSDKGLEEVADPSGILMAARDTESAGSAVFAGLEGTRPLLMEIQALVSPSTLATPRRAVVGWDQSRLAMILAVLEARAGISIGANDVYLNVVGGIRIREPAADLAVAAALISSMTGSPLPASAVMFGEVALSGSIRPVSQTAQRLKEAAKLGLDLAVIPAGSDAAAPKGMRLKQIGGVAELTAWAASLSAGNKRTD